MNENYTLKSETSNLIRISSLLILIETWNNLLLYLGATFVLQFFATIQLPTSASELRKALFAGLTLKDWYLVSCHFSQDHAIVTKILDFIHKHPKYKSVKSFFYYHDRFSKNLAETDKTFWFFGIKNCEIDFFFQCFQ